MKIFKAVNLGGSFKNNTINYLLLVHFSVSNGSISLQDENGAIIEQFTDSVSQASALDYPSISGSENLSTGAISYNAFNSTFSYASSISKSSMQKIIIPPGYSISGINAGLFLELENLDELRGLI